MNLQHQAGTEESQDRQTKHAVGKIRPTRLRGFTLTEMLVVLAIIAIFAGFAIPSFRGLVNSASISSAVNAFVSDTRYARGEAMRRGNSVTICRSAAPAAAPPKCSGANDPTVGSWKEGWVVFADENGNGSFNAASDTVLRVQQTLTGIGSFSAMNTDNRTANNRNYIVYQATGRAVGYAGRWQVQAPDASNAANNSHTRTLCVNSVGRVRILAGGGLCPR